MAKIIDGKKISEKILSDAHIQTQELKDKGITPGLAIVQVGDNPASNIYIGKKIEAAKKIGLKAVHVKLGDKISFTELEQKVTELNKDNSIHGIIIQMPLPKQINTEQALSLVLPKKDVDGFHPFNQGKLFSGTGGFTPATAKGIIKLINSTKQKIAGKNAVVIGRSTIVGRPTAALLLSLDATVTVCHSKTKNLIQFTKNADILVVAAGKAKLVKKNMVKKGAIVIDVGIDKVRGKIFGDVDFENVKSKAGFITPVPGGVGPMTVACLIENTIDAAKRQTNASS